MRRQDVGFEQLSDIMAFRVIVEHRRRLSLARRHSQRLFHGAQAGQGLHIDTEIERISVDPHRRPGSANSGSKFTRTREMHEVAERVAAHRVYKQNPNKPEHSGNTVGFELLISWNTRPIRTTS